MRPIIKLFTLCVTMTAALPAMAKNDAWYIGVEGGAMIVDDLHYDIGVRGNDAGHVNSNYGWDVDGTIGYDFGGFRAEAEVGYRRASLDTLTYSIPTPVYTSTGAVGIVPAGTYDGAGRTSALDFMVNGLIDIGKDDGVQGFLGGGGGVARVAGKYGLAKYGDFLDDSDTVFAWQILAGLRAPISDKLDLTFKYRFFNTSRADLTDIQKRHNDLVKFQSHSFVVGLAFNFGAPPPPPPPPVVEVPSSPPPPPVVASPPPSPPPVIPGPAIVFFDWDKDEITAQAKAILDNAIEAYQAAGTLHVILAGHADRSGPSEYNVGLSQRRANNVGFYLAAHGVPTSAITTEAFGEAKPLVETADGVREVQNRRVEISFGPGSGW